MTADSYSSRLGLIKQFTGNNNNNWGDIFNSSFTDVIERVIAGVSTHADTGGTVDLSTVTPPAGPTSAVDFEHLFTGALVSDLTLKLPNVPRLYLIGNFTTNAFSLFVTTASGSNTVDIPQGTLILVWVNISNYVSRLDGGDVGQIRMHAGTSVPAGYMACNGASLLRAKFPSLFNSIGTTWGAADGTHFTLPNLQDTGRFPRSSSGSLTVGTYQTNQNKSHTHTGSGSTGAESVDHTHAFSGTTGTSNQSLSHTHTDTTNTFAFNAGTGAFPINANTTASTTGATDLSSHNHSFSGTTSGDSVAHTHAYSFTTSTGSADGTEARPEAAVVMFVIKY